MPKKGHISPSRFKDVMTTSRGGGGFGKTALSYADEVVLDIIGVETEGWTSNAVEHGNEYEWLAIQVYEEERIVSVEQPGRLTHPEHDFISGEPDGLVGSDGIIEVKCPWNSKNHLGNLIEAEQLHIYQWQIQGYLWITGRKWCDFVSFDPRFPKKYQLSVNRVVRDDGMISDLEGRCINFWVIVQEKLESIQLLTI